MRLVLCAVVLFGISSPAAAQSNVPPRAKTVNLSGPRFGLTVLSEGVVEKLAERHLTVGHNISQFGWQFEKQFFSHDSGVTAVTEWIALLGGLDQSVAIPSLTWMVGVRTREGAEFGIGPNVTPGGSALAIAAGVTFRAGVLNVPVNVAFVPSKAGTRVSVLTGFNLRGR